MDTFETACRILAPEDIARGDYILPMYERVEMVDSPSFMCDSIGPLRVVSYELVPEDPEGPLRVLDICLPFLLVRKFDGSHRMLDVRRARLARLDRVFAIRAIKKLRPSADRAKDVDDA